MGNFKKVELDLLKDFPPPSYKEWQKAVEDSLKGADFEKAMYTRTYEGISLKPIYRREDIQDLPFTNALPGQEPYVRGSEADGYTKYGWVVAQSQTEPDLEKLNHSLLDELHRGLNCVNLVLHPASLSGRIPSSKDASSSGVPLSHSKDIKTALQGVLLSAVPVVIIGNETSLIQLGLLNAHAKAEGIPLRELKGCVAFDPFAANYHNAEQKDMQKALDYLCQMTQWADLKAPGMRTLLLDSARYADNGATAVQELAYALGTATCIIDHLMLNGLSIEQIAPHFVVRMSLGSNLFMEIAKVRAMRMLWTELIRAYNGSEDACKIWIHGITARRNKSHFDAWVNILRTSTESFAGIIGGVDSLEVLPYDEGFDIPNEFSRRVARNQQLILAEEAHLQKVIDPAGGCWYIETLTSELAYLAWKRLQEIENTGGFIKAINSGEIAREIDAIANARVTNFENRKDVMVGVNMFADPAEKPVIKRKVDPKWLDGAMARYAKLKQARNTGLDESLKLIRDDRANAFIVDMICDAFLHGADIEQVRDALGFDGLKIFDELGSRTASSLESLRTAVVKHKASHKAQIFLMNMGSIAQHKARAEFSSGFFQAGSFDVINPSGFASVEEALNAWREANTPAVCICSTDDTYPELVPAICKALKASQNPPVIILAGYPSDMVESYRSAGVNHFIHIRANVFTTLKAIAEHMGVQA